MEERMEREGFASPEEHMQEYMDLFLMLDRKSVV